jgi:HSP20 family protein
MAKSNEVERVPLPDLFDVWRRPFGFGRLARLLDEEGEDALKVDEFREGDVLVVRADMPGIDPEKDVEITITNGALHVRAERRSETETKDREYRRTEIRYGAFSRVLPLPPGASDKDVKATYKDGVLEVRLPVVTAAPGSKAIPVKRG